MQYLDQAGAPTVSHIVLRRTSSLLLGTMILLSLSFFRPDAVQSQELTKGQATKPETQPAAIVGKGYRLVWNDEFESLKSIDFHNTGKTGYRWYVNTGTFSEKIVSSVTIPEASVVRINHGGFPNWQLSSSYSLDVGLNMAGVEGFYVEGRIRFPAKRGDLSTGWPAFWLNPSENNYGGCAVARASCGVYQPRGVRHHGVWRW